MKNALLKFAGFFVEKVPVDQGPSPAQRQHQLLQGSFPTPAGVTAYPAQQQPPQAPPVVLPEPVQVALRAWVPAEYAQHLAPHGLFVIAAGGELTVEQAQIHGAQALVVSAECLGSHTHLLSSPQMPTVLIATSSLMVPARPGIVQVQDPLRVSDLATAVREAVAAWPGPA